MTGDGFYPKPKHVAQYIIIECEDVGVTDRPSSPHLMCVTYEEQPVTGMVTLSVTGTRNPNVAILSL